MYNQTPPKIFFLKRELAKQGGLEKSAKVLVSAFKKKGCETHLLSCDESLSEDFILHPLKKKKGFSYQKVSSFDKRCLSYLKNKKSQCLFGLDRNSYQTHLRAGNGCHLSYLLSRKQTDGKLKNLSFKFNPLHNLILSIEKKSFENPDLKKLFTNSEMVKKEILTYYNVPEEKISVIHNGVEWTDLQTPFDHSLEIRPYEKLFLNPHAFQLLFIGNNYFRKGLVPLLKALSHFKNTPFELCVIGKEKNLSFFKKLTSSLQLDSKVHFRGMQKDVIPFYQCADAVVIPSFYDPFANVTVEALAMGAFVLTSSKNGGKEVLTSESGAIIENLNDQEEWIERLKMTFEQIKTKERAIKIRNTIKSLDFSQQIGKMVDQTIKSIS